MDRRLNRRRRWHADRSLLRLLDPGGGTSVAGDASHLPDRPGRRVCDDGDIWRLDGRDRQSNTRLDGSRRLVDRRGVGSFGTVLGRMGTGTEMGVSRRGMERRIQQPTRGLAERSLHFRGLLAAGRSSRRRSQNDDREHGGRAVSSLSLCNRGDSDRWTHGEVRDRSAGLRGHWSAVYSNARGRAFDSQRPIALCGATIPKLAVDVAPAVLRDRAIPALRLDDRAR